MMAELGMTPSAGGVARRYDDLIDGYVCDFADMDQVAGISAKVTLGQTMMNTLADREALARTVLGAARVLRRDR
jgi:LPPG:FO 2-phospho-L-lactate transferase